MTVEVNFLFEGFQADLTGERGDIVMDEHVLR
jgi:hypothetical protein